MTAAPSFQPAVAPPEGQGPEGWWFLFAGPDLLLQRQGEEATVPWLADPAEPGLVVGPRLYLGRLGGAPVWAAGLEGERPELGPGWEFQGPRQLFGQLPEAWLALALRAVHLVHWDATHRFCGRCGQPTRPSQTERARSCAACGLTGYPVIAPAVIMAVSRGRELLLARARHYPPGRYSVLAGFVEPGETLEETVKREIGEEVGLEIDQVTYFGSQPWPFPNQLMAAFTARWAGGELRPDPQELEAAGWFLPENLPGLPPPYTISRRLIDAHLARARLSP